MQPVHFAKIPLPPSRLCRIMTAAHCGAGFQTCHGLPQAGLETCPTNIFLSRVWGPIMRHVRLPLAALTILLLMASPCVQAATPTQDYQPDPKAVERYGPAYRYPQAGWIVLHIEGKPYERGYQHGRLLAPEIAAFVKNSATLMSPQSPADGWRNARTLINALFLRRYEKEYLEEMKGIADGAAAGGAKFDGRPIDLTDIVPLNPWPPFETPASALAATPPPPQAKPLPPHPPPPIPPAKP